MLTPEELAMIPDDMVAIFQQLDEFVIKDFARRVAKTGTITDTAMWQATRMQELGKSLTAIEEEVARTLDVSYSYIDSLFSQSAKQSMEVDNKTYETAGLDVNKIQNSTVLDHYLKAAIAQTQGEMFNITRSLGFAQIVNGKTVYKTIAKYYQDALDLAQWQVSSGVLDYQTAVRNAVKTISQSGIRYIDYDSGWANRVDVAVRRATLTGVNQMSAKMNDFYSQELGLDLVEVTAHAGARPSHAAWQGKVFSRSGKSNKYPPFSDTGIGTGDGLLGWNCRHSYHGYVDGQPRMYTADQLSNIDPKPITYNGKEYTYYEATQYQRQIENGIRITKRDVIGYKEAGLKGDFTAASIDLNQQKQLYKDFSKAANLRMRLNRTGVLGYDKSISQKAVWANKKAQKAIAEKQRCDTIKSEIKKGGIRGTIDINPSKIDISNYAFDSEHINIQRQHNMTLKEVNEIIKNSDISLTRWNGRFLNYYSDQGAVYVDVINKIIRTAFKSDEFDDKTKLIREVMKRYGKAD